MQVCPHCGSVYAYDALYCRHCGQKRHEVGVASPPLPGQLEPITGGGHTGAPCTVRPLSPLPVHGRVLACGPQAGVASPVASPSQHIVASPNVQVHSGVPLPVPSLHVMPQSEASQAGSEDLLKRINGVVSQMEQELTSDLAACVKSPEKRTDEQQADGHRGVEWIDHEIRCKERRREACESRQAHLADLRRLVALRSEENARQRPASRLSILEDEHQELRKQVEAERVELMKVANLQLECEGRIQEAGCLAQSVQESRQHALALQQAANERSREAANQLQSLQATLEHERQQHRQSQEAQQASGLCLKQLEEASQSMVAENQMLQQKIREMELERSAFLENQDQNEEERQSLALRIREVQAQRENDLGSFEVAQNRIRQLESDKDALTSEVHAEQQRSRLEKEEQEKELRKTRAEAKDLRRSLDEQLQMNAQLKALEGPTRRLSILEGGHEELKKQVETERLELHKVRASLQVECERRLQEERAFAESTQANRQQALAAQEAANQRLREDAQQLHVLQERLRDAEATLEREKDAHLVAGVTLREENQTLQQKVRELDLEHAKLLQSRGDFEEERRSLVSQINDLQSQRESDLATLRETQARLRSLQSEKEMLTADVDGQLQHSQREREDLQQELHEAQDMLQQLRKKLAKQEEQVQIFEEQHKTQAAEISALQAQLNDEKQEAQALRREVVECQTAGQKLQVDAEAALSQLLALQQQKEDLQRSLDEARKDDSAAVSSRKRQKTRQQSLWAESVSLPVEEEELLPNSTDGFVKQVREAHLAVDQLMDSAAKVHIGSLTMELELLADSKEDVEELLESKKELQMERGLMVNELDARGHDLRALREKVVLQHHLSAEEQEQVTLYIKRDIARCEEELKIMKLSDSLAAVPEGLIQELLHMKEEGLPGEPGDPGYENGFSPMHWAAQHGRRDLVEFIREKVDKGSELLRSRDSLGRIPLFFAKREGEKRAGLAYHLSRIGGFSDLLVRSSKKRPNIEDLAPAYQKVLEEIEKHSWRAMNWKGGWTMLHWAAKHDKKELCLYLLTQQANPNDQDDEGRSAVDVARENGHVDLLAAMQQEATMHRKSVSSGAFASTPKE